MNDAEMGITWSVEKVSQKGMELHGDALIPVVVDLTAAITFFGADAIIGSLDGSSWRVMAQSVCRDMLPTRPTPEALKTAIINRLRGVRNSAKGRAPKVVYTLPNGAKYEGSDLVEYRQLFVAAMVDGGCPASVAVAMSEKLTF